MAIALEQDKTTIGASQTDGITVTFDTTPTAGNLVVVGLAMNNVGRFSQGDVTDNQGNSYFLAEEDEEGSGNIKHAAIFYATNISSSGTFTITIDIQTVNDDPPTITATAMEFSGASNGSVNATAAANGSSTTPSAGTLTTTTAGEVIISVFGSGAPTSITEGSGYTEVNSNTTGQPQGTQYRIGATATGYATEWTLGASAAWACVAASFRETSGPGSSDGLLSIMLGNVF